ncbi:MAG: YihY/virulence factor BrkB family protein [Bacteroidota bacterium]
MDKYIIAFKKNRTVKFIIDFLQRKHIPGYPEIAWYAVLMFCIRWIDQRDMKLRARSLSFSFFLSLFPSAIFFFTLIAYLPFTKSHDILFIFSQIIPEKAFKLVSATIDDILHHQRGGLLSIGFISAMYFSTNGFHSLMNLLNIYSNQKETRTFLKQRIVAFILAFVVSTSLIISLFLVTFGTRMIRLLNKMEYFPSKTTPFLLSGLTYLIVIGICLTIVSTIYFWAPNRTRKFKFFSPGSVFATISILATSIMFSFYVNHFNSYNKLYGSIGAIIVILILIYENTYMLLLGFELNVTIDKTVAQFRREKKKNKVIFLKSEAEIN